MSDFASIYGDYGQQAAAAVRRRENQRLANQQSIFYGQQRGNRSLEELTRKFSQGFRPQVASLARRGLGNSGIARQALSKYAEQYQRNIDAQRSQNAQDMQSLADAEQAQQDALEEYLAQLRFQKQRDVLATASDLSNIGQFGG